MADVRLGDAVTTGGPSRRIIVVLVVEFLIIVAGLTTAVAFAANSGPHSGLTAKVFFWQDKADGDASDRANAVSVARQFVLNSDAFNPTDVSGYINDLKPLMTTKGQTALASQYAQFQQLAGELLSQVTKTSKAAAVASSGSIEFAALSAFGASTATVLVAHDVLYGSVKSAQCPKQPNYCQSKRWSVTLNKVGGHWLVDTFNPNV